MSFKTFRGYNRVKFQSQKLNTTVFCNSIILKDYLIHLEWDDEVQFYELKPLKIAFNLGGVAKTFYPHLLVTRHTVREVVWIKSITLDITNDNLFERTISDICRKNDFNFVVKTTDEIRREPLFTNLKILRRYSLTELTFSHNVLCREFFVNFADHRFGNFIKFLHEQNVGVQVAYALLARKIISADVNYSPIESDTSIKLHQTFSRLKMEGFSNE